MGCTGLARRPHILLSEARLATAQCGALGVVFALSPSQREAELRFWLGLDTGGPSASFNGNREYVRCLRRGDGAAVPGRHARQLQPSR